MDETMVTAPKPFVFVLMPFDPQFDDIYRFGIKGAAQEVGAYAERLDEQLFVEGMLDRIFNQISKADVIVADLTGRNPNVFYEVGYAHALGKVVLLLTRAAEDIPFDLKHRQHTIYGGSIETLRSQLVDKMTWAIAEAKLRQSRILPERIQLAYEYVEIPERSGLEAAPRLAIPVTGGILFPEFVLRNCSTTAVPQLTHIYALMQDDSVLRLLSSASGSWHPARAIRTLENDGLPLMYRADGWIPPMPPGAVERCTLAFEFAGQAVEADTPMVLRFHGGIRTHEYAFVLHTVIPAIA